MVAGNRAVGNMVSRGTSTIDGSFEFLGVLPGTYYLAAQERSSGMVSTPLTVQVGNRDVDNVSIGIAPGISLGLRVILDGVTPNPGGIIIIARPDIDSTILGTVGSAQPSGSLTNLAPGDYQFDLIAERVPNQKPLHIQSMRLGQTDAMGAVRISSSTTDVLEVVLTRETGSVEGTVAAGATAATVVLVPNARKRMPLYKTVVPGADGRFLFEDIPPGDYKLFAWEDVETGAWQNAEFIRQFETRGRAVRISEKSKEDVQLDVIR
jgi:hypothetical protein